RSKASLARPMPACCPSDGPVGTSAKDAAAFNTHSPGCGGSGLAQQVFRSPARIPAAESRRHGLCAAPASEKRYSLSRVVELFGGLSGPEPAAVVLPVRITG